LIIDRDVRVSTRDGTTIAADVFRPDTDERVPAIVCISPYGKDIHWPDRYPLYDLVEHGDHMVWETPNPEWWTAHGYAIVRADTRGTGKSPGRLDLFSVTDAEDYYDLIEHVAQEPWCSGRTATSGISWFAMMSWRVAALEPPHLSAVIAWEGLTDFYREWSRQGGIYTSSFQDFWWSSQIVPQINSDDVVNLPEELRSRPLLDDWYRERTADLSRIRVPLLSAANWGSLHLHHRGNIEGWLGAASKDKWLVVHAGTHIDPFYSEWGKDLQLRFLDRFLKGRQDAMDGVSPVRLAIRAGREIRWRDERQWPPAQIVWTDLHLGDGTLTTAVPAAQAMPYPALFETAPSESEIEITGPLALRLWISSDLGDADLMARVHHIDGGGNIVHGIGPQGGPIPMAMGWLRASHRKLDAARSLPYRPWHVHDQLQPLEPGRPTPIDVEIWPTSMTLQPGDRLRLELVIDDEDLGVLAHNDPSDRRSARGVTIHTGDGHPSKLRIPSVGSERNATSW
jgi:predicted acyl esterase